MLFTPREYQKIIRDYILNRNRCAIWAQMGLGKTSATLLTLDTLQLIENNKTLVLAPLRVARSVWPDEIKKWDNFNRLKIVSISGDKKERLEALKEPADIHTMNYENLQWLIEQNYFPWKTIVADESTKLKSFRLRQGSKRAQALAKVAFSKVNRFIELTGTPSPNGLIDLWGQVWFLDKGERLGRTFTAFLQRWFRLEHPNSYNFIPLPNAQEEIQNRISDICLSLRAQDYFDLKNPIMVDIPVHLPDEAMEIYKQMEKELFLKIGDKEIEAFNAASMTMKCLQLANGAIYTDENKEWTVIHDGKLDALEDIIEESAGMPILVAYHFKSDLTRLKKRFPQGKELDKNEATIREWNKGKIPLLFAHPASAGHGINLQDGGNIVVMFGHWWNLEEYQQIIERIGPTRQLQAGHNRPVYIYNIRAVDTIDTIVIQSRTNKRRVQDLLLEAARKN